MLFRSEEPAGLDDLAKPRIHALSRVGRVDQHAQRQIYGLGAYDSVLANLDRSVSKDPIGYIDSSGRA